MERNQAISVAVGVGAVGTALAYLGYSYYNKESDTANLVEEPKQQTAWWNNLFENSNTVTQDDNTLYTEKVSTETVESTGDIETVDKSTSVGTSAWGQFWKGEYDDNNEKLEKKED